MKKLIASITTTTIAVFLFASPVIAAPTWIPEYQDGKTVYTSPDLRLKDIQAQLDEASKVQGIKFISINTIRGDDLPENQYAQALNDRLVSTWALDSDYATLVYVRNDVNPAKGSFSINVGSKWRGNFSPRSLTDFQIPILKKYMPQDPSGGIVAIANGMNHEISSQHFTNMFLLLLFGVIIFAAIIQFGSGFVLAYLADRKKKKAAWNTFLTRFAVFESEYRATFDELKYLKLVEYKGESLRLFQDIDTVFTAISADFEKTLEIKTKSSWRSNLENLSKLTETGIKDLQALSKKIAKLKTSRKVSITRFAELKESVTKLDVDHEKISELNSIIHVRIEDVDPIRLSDLIDAAFNIIKDINNDVATAEALYSKVQTLLENNKKLPNLIATRFSKDIGLKHGSEQWLLRFEVEFLPAVMQKPVLARIVLLKQAIQDLNKYWLPYQNALTDRESFVSTLRDYKAKLSVLDAPTYLKSEQANLCSQLKVLLLEPYTLTLSSESQGLFQSCEQWVKSYNKHLKTKKSVQSYSSSRVRSAEIYLDNGDYNRVDSLISSWKREDRDSSSSSSWSSSSSSSSWDSSSDFGSSSSSSDW